MHSNVTIKNVSWLQFSWATLYIARNIHVLTNDVTFLPDRQPIIVLAVCAKKHAKYIIHCHDAERRASNGKIIHSCQFRTCR